jgi:hypothetical protein
MLSKSLYTKFIESKKEISKMRGGAEMQLKVLEAAQKKKSQAL